MLTIKNFAPDMDAIDIRDDRNNNFTISIFRDEHEKVQVIVQEHFWGDRTESKRLILGRKTIEKLPGLDKVSVKKYRPRKEVRRGE